MEKEIQIDIKIKSSPLNEADNIAFVQDDRAGGIDVFIGTVRNSTDDKSVKYLEFESYEAMAKSELTKIIYRAVDNWPLIKISVHHRIGKVSIGESAVVIAVSAAHRDAAFRGCRFIIDELKKTVPIWKKEVFDDGEVWVSAHP